ncbi:MAG: hypothetical protein IT289_07490 [Oligoflexia bacterium]|nr:hypothetical protein [Oligoflexia bacterium]
MNYLNGLFFGLIFLAVTGAAQANVDVPCYQGRLALAPVSTSAGHLAGVSGQLGVTACLVDAQPVISNVELITMETRCLEPQQPSYPGDDDCAKREVLSYRLGGQLRVGTLVINLNGVEAARLDLHTSVRSAKVYRSLEKVSTLTKEKFVLEGDVSRVSTSTLRVPGYVVNGYPVDVTLDVAWPINHQKQTVKTKTKNNVTMLSRSQDLDLIRAQMSLAPTLKSRVRGYATEVPGAINFIHIFESDLYLLK